MSQSSRSARGRGPGGRDRDSEYYKRYRGQVRLDDVRLAQLRPGQRGAVFAMRSWATAPDHGVAILGLPTGYGKSELIALAPFLFGSRRVLIIAPSVVVRSQLAERTRAQRHLREVGIVPSELARPAVSEHVGQIGSSCDWEQFEAYDVVVSHTQSVSPSGKPVADPPDPELFDLVLFDEAHHLGAPSWVGVRDAFPAAVAVGFTATPYRRDRRMLPGRTIFQYPIDKAVDEGFFVPIVYREVQADATADSRDRAVAIEAIAELQQRDTRASEPAARLLVRADTVDRAKALAKLYHGLDSGVTLEIITHETSRKELEAATLRLRSGASAGVAFVGVLGEGFDLPSLKIAAYHNPHRSLPVTIQFAGRVARTELDGTAASDTPEQAVLIATVGDHPEILAELHKDGQRWDRLIPELARELGEGSERTWTVFSSDTAGMADAFTIENFRTFMLADVYRLPTAASDHVLAEALATLHVSTPAMDASVDGESRTPRDSARSVKVLRSGACFAVLLARERQVQWLEETPSHPEYEYIVLALERHGTDGNWWLCVRSTLPPDMTQRALTGLFGAHLEQPSRSQLAQYRADAWTDARFTGLGKRAIHPVVAGVLSYETGAGRGVDRALTLDDRALHEAGHAIGVVAPRPGAHEPIQIGIAIDKRRVWQVGYASLSEYADWAASLCRELEQGAPVSQLGGLRVADGDLDPAAEPLAAMLDPNFDPTWDAEFSESQNVFAFRDLELVAQRRQSGADIVIELRSGRTALTTIVYADDGRLLSTSGEFRRRGRSEPFDSRLRRYPISVFFNDGSVLRGPGGCIAALDDGHYFALSDQPRALDAANRFAVLERSITLLPEKDAGSTRKIIACLTGVAPSTKPTSLFQFAVSHARREHAEFIFCDDGANEVADFVIGWHAHPVGGQPHLRLIHCKAMAASERARLAAGGEGIRESGLKVAEEVGQQALRSVAFLLRSPTAMLAQLERRAQGHPERFLTGDRSTFESILSTRPTARTAEIWVVHPGLSRSRLLAGQGRSLRTLLSAVRVRAVDARADLAVLGRP